MRWMRGCRAAMRATVSTRLGGESRSVRNVESVPHGTGNPSDSTGNPFRRDARTMRIAIDIESTLHHYWDQFAAAAKRRFGVDLPYDEQMWEIDRLKPEQVRACV